MLNAQATRTQLGLLWLPPIAGLLALCTAALRWLSLAAIPFLVSMTGIAFLIWLFSSAIVTRLSFNGQTLTLDSARTHERVTASDVRLIDASPWNRGSVQLTSVDRRVFVLGNMPGLLEVLEAVSKAAPGIQVRGVQF